MGDKKWEVRGKVWPSEEAEPAESMIRYTAVGELPDGDPSVMGFPMSGKPLYFDALTVKPIKP